MAGPYKLVNCLIKIGGATVGVIETGSMEMTIEGGVVHFYGSRTGKHAKGAKRCTFSLTRMYKTDTDTSLLYDLFTNETPFTLTAEIDGVTGSILTMSDCQVYTYRPRMGSPNDIFAETVEGEAVVWTTGPTD